MALKKRYEISWGKRPSSFMPHSGCTLMAHKLYQHEPNKTIAALVRITQYWQWSGATFTSSTKLLWLLTVLHDNYLFFLKVVLLHKCNCLHVENGNYKVTWAPFVNVFVTRSRNLISWLIQKKNNIKYILCVR